MRGSLTQQDIEQLARQALEEGVSQIDAGTLSRLNHARHSALENTSKLGLWRGWVPASAAACAALVLVLALPMNVQKVAQPKDESLMMPALTEEVSLAALEDRELLEDLDMMLWLIEVGNHAS